jgi:hypothetical protein
MLWTSPIYKQVKTVAKGGFTGKKRDARGYNICYQNGKRVPCNALGEGKKKPASKKPAKKPVEQSVKEIKDLVESGQGTPEKLLGLIASHTVAELKQIQKDLGLSVKGNPLKAKRANAISQAALQLSKSASSDSPDSEESKTKYVMDAKGAPKELVDKVTKAMGYIPSNVHELFKAYGGSVVVTNKVTDYKKSLKNKTPRGWPPGSTWDDADGIYIESDKEAIVTSKSSRTEGTIKHEYGHGVDAALGYFSNSPEFLEAYGKDADSIGGDPKLSYFLQEGEAGRSEAFAEIFAQLYKGEERKSNSLFKFSNSGGASPIDLSKYFPNVLAVIKAKMESL